MEQEGILMSKKIRKQFGQAKATGNCGTEHQRSSKREKDGTQKPRVFG